MNCIGVLYKESFLSKITDCRFWNPLETLHKMILGQGDLSKIQPICAGEDQGFEAY